MERLMKYLVFTCASIICGCAIQFNPGVPFDVAQEEKKPYVMSLARRDNKVWVKNSALLQVFNQTWIDTATEFAERKTGCKATNVHPPSYNVVAMDLVCPSK